MEFKDHNTLENLIETVNSQHRTPHMIGCVTSFDLARQLFTTYLQLGLAL